MNLNEIRVRIDEIDSKIIPLLVERMKLAIEVAEYKKSQGIPIFNSKREEQILENVEKECGIFGGACRTVYSNIMDMSRGIQHDILQSGDELRKEILKATNESVEFKPMIVACQGVSGAYSDAAATTLYPDSEKLFYAHFEDVFKAVDNGDADCGIIPVENSFTGSVHEVYDLIMKYRFYISGAIELPVQHYLLGVSGSKIEDIKTVLSHHQALSQCSEYIGQHGFAAVTCSNTAVAAKTVAQQKDKTCAAIASYNSANIYGLDILSESIQNISNNVTRFIVISKKMHISENSDKISVIFSLPHKKGTLHSILSRFAMHQLNLTKIESRPIRGTKFMYNFYVDFSGNLHDKSTINLLCSLYDQYDEFSFLGNFPEKTID